MTIPDPLTVEQMELMSPDERARAVRERSIASLEDVDPSFRKRVEETGRRLLADRGLLDVEQS